MPGTRSSARLADKPIDSSPPSAEAPSNGTKRKAESSPSSMKKGKKQQKTLEDTFPVTDQEGDRDQPEDIEMQEAESVDKGTGNPGHEGGPSCWFWLDNETYVKKDNEDSCDESKIIKAGESWTGKTKEGEDKSDPEKALKDSRGGAGLNALDVEKPKVKDVPHDDVHAEAGNRPSDVTSQPDGAADDGAIKESKDRAQAMPSNIMEKGLIYFFTRGRVGIEDPENVTELQRSYFVLRPLPDGAKLGDGAIEDLRNNRLLALPKKVWPKSARDKFMAFVEKGKATIDDLKKDFMEGSQYETKTVGTRQTPPVTPLAEGVYAMTKAGDRDETHLAYMLTIPKDPGEMQEDIGISSKGSFIVSLKNPTSKGPAYASLPESPGFPQEFIDEFRGRSWMPAEPKHLDYPNAQILLIGESFDSSHALDATSKDKKSDDKETPLEELEKLEGEDEIRVEHLNGDDSVFEDLQISHKDYPSVPTTW